MRRVRRRDDFVGGGGRLGGLGRYALARPLVGRGRAVIRPPGPPRARWNDELAAQTRGGAGVAEGRSRAGVEGAEDDLRDHVVGGRENVLVGRLLLPRVVSHGTEGSSPDC